MEPTQHPAESLVGRTIGSYRVEELIGQGGMGEVYRARDLELPRDVALKAMRGSRAQDETARARFVRETRLAAQVSHPYVATVLGVEEHDQDLFLVMEYIDGRRLDRVVRDDEPDNRELTRLGVQIAQALGAIHDAGLVHRDLKPGNVMVRPDGHVKVLDFGVARQQEIRDTGDPGRLTMATEEARLTQEGAAVGTVLYMSPEQLRSEKLDQRSDLFALGVLLYEAIAREHPFARSTPHESVSAILNDPPGRGTDPQTMTEAGLLRDVVHRLLEKAPGRRYQSADDVAVDLQNVLEGKRPSRRPIPRKQALGAAVAVAAVATLAVTAWLVRTAFVQPLPGRDLVAVLPFVDETGESGGAVRGKMLAALLAADLSETKHLRSLGHDRLAEVLETMATASGTTVIAGVQQATPVRWILAGRVFRPGDAYDVIIDVYRAGTTEPYDTFRVSAAAPLALVDLASVGLLPRIVPGLVAGDDDTPASERVSTEAMEQLYRAREAVREHDFAEAMRLLESAVEREPRFLAGHTWLASTRNRAGYGDSARESADTVRRLLEGDLAATIGRRQLLESRAVCAGIAGDAESQESARRELAELHPDDPRVLYELAEVLRAGGAHDEGLAVIERAVGLDPTDPWLPMMQGKILRGLQRFDDAAAALDTAFAIYTEMGSLAGQSRIEAERGHLAWYRREYDEARAFYESAAEGYAAAGLEVLSARARGNAARTMVVTGEFEAADRLLDSVIPELRVAGNYRSVLLAQNSLAAVWYRQGDLHRAERLFAEAVAGAEELGNDRALVEPLGGLAKVKVLLGRLGEGRGLAERTLGLARQQESRFIETKMLRVMADIDYQQGDLRAAAEAYRDLLDLARSPSGTAEDTAYALGGLGEVFHEGNRLAQALEVTDQSVEAAEEADARALRAFMRARRAYLLGELGDWAGAEQEIATVSGLVGEGEERLAGADARLRITEAAVELFRGDWNRAEERAQHARAASEGLGPQLEVPVLLLSSEAALRLGRHREAARLAESAVSFPGATAIHRAKARVALARALRKQQSFREAAAAAAHALDEAESMDLPFVVARAASVLCALPDGHRPHDIEGVRERGRTALARFFEFAPPGSRDGMLGRADIQETMTRLNEPDPVKATDSGSASNLGGPPWTNRKPGSPYCLASRSSAPWSSSSARSRRSETPSAASGTTSGTPQVL